MPHSHEEPERTGDEAKDMANYIEYILDTIPATWLPFAPKYDIFPEVIKDGHDLEYLFVAENINKALRWNQSSFPYTEDPQGTLLTVPVWQGELRAKLKSVYSGPMRERVKGGKLMFNGLKTYWRRFKCILHFCKPDAEITVTGVIRTCDECKWQGEWVASTLAWAGEAFGLPFLKRIAEKKTVSGHTPGTIEEQVRPQPETKKAPWMDDIVYCWIETTCRHPHKPKMWRCLWMRTAIIGGMRFNDARQIIEIKVMGHTVRITLRRMKGSKTNKVTILHVPVCDRNGDSLAESYEYWIAQSQVRETGYLLPEVMGVAVETVLSSRELSKPLSYSKAQLLLRAMAREAVTSMDHSLKPRNNSFQDADPINGVSHDTDMMRRIEYARTVDMSRITLHSARAWLTTLLSQAGWRAEEMDIVLNWTQSHDPRMSNLYNRNSEGREIRLRMRILQILTKWRTWRCMKPGDVPKDPVELEPLDDYLAAIGFDIFTAEPQSNPQSQPAPPPADPPQQAAF